MLFIDSVIRRSAALEQVPLGILEYFTHTKSVPVIYIVLKGKYVYGL
jgi:hypothetical protein